MITRKILLGILLIPFLISPLKKNQVAFAEEPSSKWTVVAASLNVREAADISSKVIGLVHKGDTFAIIQNTNNWDQIKLLNNKTGWVYHDYITPAKNIEATVEAKVLNVREKPSLSSKVVGQLKWGTKITIQLEHAGWGKLLTPSGVEGWVNEYYITKNTATIEQPKPSIEQPKPSVEQPKPSIEQPKPSVEQPKPSIEQTKPSVEQTQPTIDYSEPTISAEQIPNSQQPLKGRTIVLDPGHGGMDPGTQSMVGTPEKILTLETAKAVEQKLETAGANVIMTRMDDTYISLPQRAQIANQNHADAFISFHYNWSNDPSVNGLDAFYYQTSKDSKLAADLLNEIIKATNLKSAGTRFNNLSVLRNNSQPSTLIELGYVSNKQEDTVVESPAYRDNVAQGIYQGLIEYFSGP